MISEDLHNDWLQIIITGNFILQANPYFYYVQNIYNICQITWMKKYTFNEFPDIQT